ncbi:MAG: T9SS type A sorting domain-containing protein [Ignavibacteriaceae bacterium]|nr:T9SS type A sorting domain-containing protein [Ignavibacteriaceae bacterium]
MLSLNKIINFFLHYGKKKIRVIPRARIVRRQNSRESSENEPQSRILKDKSGAIMFMVLVFLLQGLLNAQWQQTNLTPTINALMHDGTYLFAASNQGVHKSGNNGTNWNDENTGLTTLDARGFAVQGTNIFTVTFSGGIYRSVNGPSWSWSLMQAGSFHCIYTSGNTLLAGSVGGGIYISNNNGTTWAVSNSGLTNLTVWSIHASGSNLYAGTLGGVFRSTDNGSTWSAANTGITSLDIRAVYSVGNVLFAGSNGGGVYRSTDSGGSWAQKAGGSVYAFSLVCGTDLYAGLLNNGGIIKSTDNGLTWTGDNTGLQNPTVTSFATGANYLFAGTFGGAYKKEINCPVNTSCITWNLLQSGAVTSASSGMNGVTQVIGAGTSSPFMSVFTPYTSNGQRLWCGTTGWQAGTLDPARFIEFTVSPAPGGSVTINNVSFNYGDNPLTVNMNILSSKVFYSTDGWSTSTQLGGTLSYLNTTMQTFNQNIPGGVTITSGQSFSMRIYPYSTVGSNPMSPSFATHNNVTFCGSAAAGTLCDSLSASATRTDPNDCTWQLDIHNPVNLQGISAVQVLCLAPNQFTTGTGLGTNYQNWITTGSNIFMPPSGTVPGGVLHGFYNMNLINVTNPQLIVVNWLGSDLEIVCSDTLELNCEVGCAVITSDTTWCNASGFGYGYKFTNTANFTISKVEYMPLSPSGITITPANTNISPAVPPGGHSQLQMFSVSGASIGDTIRIRAKFKSQDNCCWCYEKIEFVVNTCATLCDSLSVSATGSPKNCVYSISLQNNSSTVFSNVEFVIAGDGMFSNFTSSQAGWGFTNVWPNNRINLVRVPPSQGIGNGSFNNVLDISVAQYTSPFQKIAVNWMKDGNILCSDTIILNCIPTLTPDDSCSQLLYDTAYCTAAGGYNLVYRIRNNSNIITSGYGIHSVTQGVTFSQNIFNNVNILPGQVSTLDTIFIGGVQPGDTVRYQIAIFTTPVSGDTVFNYCCHSDTLVLIMPPCPSTSVGELPSAPSDYALQQNYPNPFNPSTSITYSIPESGNVNLAIFDILGKEVAVLVDEKKAPGTYTVKFDASGLNSGLYIYRLTSGSFTQARKLVLLK